MWCHGSTCLVRIGDHLFASGLETVPDAKPLNNCRWMLFRAGRRAGSACAWMTDRPHPRAVPAGGISRRPAVSFCQSRRWRQTEPNGGPGPAGDLSVRRDRIQPAARPIFSRPFGTASRRSPSTPTAVSRPTDLHGELILFQNIGYTHAEWAFRDRDGQWSAQGQLKWPWGAEYAKPQPIRVCYPNVAFGTALCISAGSAISSSRTRPGASSRSSSPAANGTTISAGCFTPGRPTSRNSSSADWIEIASREKTCGWIAPGDLYAAANGEVHVLWSERAIDERLRAKFFPEAKQTNSLNYALIRAGKIIRRLNLAESIEGMGGVAGSAGRFQVTPEGRLLIVYYAAGTDQARKAVSENRVLEMRADGSVSQSLSLGLQRPFTSYFTATTRGGSPPSRTFEMLGQRAGSPNTISYARIRLIPDK